MHRLDLHRRNPEHKPEIIRYVTTALLESLSTFFVHDAMHRKSLANTDVIYR